MRHLLVAMWSHVVRMKYRYTQSCFGTRRPGRATLARAALLAPAPDNAHDGCEQCRSTGDPILYVSNPKGMSREVRRRSLDALRKLNEQEYRDIGDPETLSRIDQYELAYRMQISVPEVMDIGRESSTTLEQYGAQPGKASFANNCLLARRLVEQGVRYVQLFDWGWEFHGTGASNDLVKELPRKCASNDKSVTALLKDLKQRGLLDETLVVWGGEFGRTSMNEERNGSKFLGRDHHPDCFTVWMAGGGCLLYTSDAADE